MSFDAGKFFSNMYSRFTRVNRVSADESNTRETEKNTKYEGKLFQYYDSPDEDVRIEERPHPMQKYAVPYFPEDENVKMYAVPDLPDESEEPMQKYAVPYFPEDENVKMYAVPDLPDEPEKPMLKYAVPNFPEDENVKMYAVPDIPNDDDIVVAKYAVPDIPGIGDGPVAMYAVPGLPGGEDGPVAMYAVPEIPGGGGTYKPTTGNIWTRLPRPIKIEFPTIFAEMFPSLSARMERLFNNISSWFNKD